MEEKRLPYAQILFAILFGLVVILAPLFIRSLEATIFLAGAAGLALGGITTRIGWMITWQGKAAIYPFRDWSLFLLRLVSGEGGISDSKHRLSAAGQKWLGIASLVLGGLGAAASLLAILFALTQVGA